MFLSKATYIAFKLQFYILSALAFPGKLKLFNYNNFIIIFNSVIYF